MPDDWEWGFVPLSSTNPPTDEAKDRFPHIESDKRGPCRKRPLDKVDPDPYVPWTDLKMGRTHTSRPDASSTGPQPQVHERMVPLQAEVGQEFLDKLASEGRKNKAPAPDAGSSQAPPAKRPRTEILGGKEVGKRRYKKRTTPVSSGPALSLSKGATGTMPGSSEGTARTSSPPRSSPEDLVPPPNTQDTGASNIGADTEAAGRAEPQVPPVLKEKKKKKKKSSCSSPSKAVPNSSASASSTPPPEAPVPEPTGATPTPPLEAPVPEPAGATPTPPPEASTAKPTRDAQMPPPAQGPSASKPTPPPEGAKLRLSEPFKGKGTASGPQSLVLDAGPAAVVAGERATGLLGRITELKREGKELGNLLDYVENWNQADVSVATRGLGKDRLPAVDPTGPRCTEEHFMRLKRAVKEFDNAWHDATSNVVVGNLQAEKEQLIRDHQKALDAQKTISRELKDQAIQAAVRHEQELKGAKAAAEARLAEVVDDSANSTAVLRAELEEVGKFWKAAEDQVARLTAEQKEYDELVTRTDALALQKVAERRVAQQFRNLDAAWDPYDHLVALSARITHMRAVDRNLADLPDLAIHLFKVLWPEEQVPASLTFTSDCLKGAGRRIREWQCSAARAEADAALRVACSWYPDLDLDALQGVREGAPTDMDPILTAKR
nr:uncharacterized protein LOC127347676 [Lolium perenne]